MKKTLLLLCLICSYFAFSQLPSSTKKWNDFLYRYEYFDSQGNKIGYEKYNKLLNRWEYFAEDRNNLSSEYKRNRNIDYWSDLERAQNQQLENQLRAIENKKSSLQQYVNELSHKASENAKIGYAYYENKDYENALEPLYSAYLYHVELEKYVTLNTSELRQYTAYYLILYGATQFHLKKYKEALETFQKIDNNYISYITANEETFYEYYTLTLFNSKHYDIVIKIANRGLNDFPNNGLLLDMKNSAISEQNKKLTQSYQVQTTNKRTNFWEESENKVVDKGRNIWTELEKKFFNNEHQKVIDLTSQLIKNKKNNMWYVYYYRARSNILLENYNEAIQNLQFLIQNYDPTLYEGYINKVYFFLAESYYGLAKKYYLLKNYQNASKYVSKALDLEESNGSIWDTKGATDYFLGKYNESIEAMDKSIAIKPKSSSFLYRGMSKIKLGRKTEGCDDIKEALAIDSENSIVKENFNKFCSK